jgi:hypothetical protein
MTLTCPRCESQLYPHTARLTVDGWACSNKGVCDARARSARLGEEIAWLRSFGWAPQQIAARLGHPGSIGDYPPICVRCGRWAK